MTDLPPGWSITPLGELLAELQNGIFVSRPGIEDTGRPILRISAVRPMMLREDDIRYVPKAAIVANEENRYIAQGDLLFTRYSGNPEYVGACARVRNPVPNTLYPDKLIRGKVIRGLADPGFIEAIFSAPQTRAIVRSLVKTTAGQVGISGADLRSVPVPLAPYREQKRIVAAIDQEFSRLEAGIAALRQADKRITELIDVLPLRLLERESVIEPEWKTLAEVSEKIVDCPHSTPKFAPRGMPCIDTTCISAGTIHRDRIRYVDSATYAERVRRLVPQHGDIVFAREGTVGTAVLLPEDLNPCLGQRVMLLRPDQSKIRGDYLCLLINSEIIKRQYRKQLLGSTVPHLNVRDAKELRVPVLRMSLQKRIAEGADQIISNLSIAQNDIETSLKKSFSLRSSILAAAFSGKLI